jgi:hypothetical protein
MAEETKVNYPEYKFMNFGVSVGVKSEDFGKVEIKLSKYTGPPNPPNKRPIANIKWKKKPGIEEDVKAILIVYLDESEVRKGVQVHAHKQGDWKPWGGEEKEDPNGAMYLEVTDKKIGDPPIAVG